MLTTKRQSIEIVYQTDPSSFPKQYHLDHRINDASWLVPDSAWGIWPKVLRKSVWYPNSLENPPNLDGLEAPFPTFFPSIWTWRNRCGSPNRRGFFSARSGNRLSSLLGVGSPRRSSRRVVSHGNIHGPKKKPRSKNWDLLKDIKMDHFRGVWDEGDGILVMWDQCDFPRNFRVQMHHATGCRKSICVHQNDMV